MSQINNNVSQADKISHNNNIPEDRPEKEGLIYFDFEQGSQEWIDLRNKYITASAIGQIIKGSHTVEYKNLVAEKASGGEHRTFFGNHATRWGHKYEPVADMLFEYRNPGVKIYEYGLISNPKYPKLAVSPDGITSLGEMLEIKCPYSRKIDGVVKREYAAQMQQQMLVCEYDVCNFLECKFVEVEEDHFWKVFSQNPCEKGIIIQSSETENETSAEKYNYYSPIDLSYNEEHLKLWYQFRLEDIAEVNGMVVKKTYWILERYLCRPVKKDPNWYSQNEKKIKQFWLDVEKTKEVGWQTTVKKKTSSPKICLLDSDQKTTPSSQFNLPDSSMINSKEMPAICWLDNIIISHSQKDNNSETNIEHSNTNTKKEELIRKKSVRKVIKENHCYL